MAANDKCDSDKQFRGRSVAVILAIAVIVVRRPPRGHRPTSEAPQARRRRAMKMNNDDMDGDRRLLLQRSSVEVGAPTQQPTIDKSVEGGWAAACKKSCG